MAIKISKFVINTNGNDIVDITEKVKMAVIKNEIENALINVHSPFSSASIAVSEYSPEMKADFSYFIKNIVPEFQNRKNSSYIKTILTGSSVSIPFIRGEFELDRFQRILLFDFDYKKRARSVIIQMIYWWHPIWKKLKKTNLFY